MRSEFAANLAIASTPRTPRPSSPRIIRNASHAAARVPSFASLVHLAARASFALVSVVVVAGAIL